MKRYAFLLFLMAFVCGVNAQNTWYTLASGDWNDADIWTLDPAGAVPVGSAVPADGDNVIVLSGKTVTVPDGVSPYDPGNDVTLTQASVTIYGSLDLRTSDGHTFSELNGTGRLLMAADNYPAITDDSDFISAGEGEGTVVYYGSSFAVTSSNTFCNLEVDMTAGQTISVADDITLNGNLVVTDGTFQINNGGTTALTIQVNGDVNIESGGNLTVGSGDAFHWFKVYGDFINEGSLDFTNSAQYSEATDGAIKLKFSGSTNNEFQCNGATELYRLFVDKGTDKTFKINVTADNSSNFTLFGPVTGATSDAADGADGWERLPIVIENGTLELGSNIIISRLGENIDGSNTKEFNIPSTGQLWINGASITTFDADEHGYIADWTGVTLNGVLKISAGELILPEESSGISYYDNVASPSSLIVNGGTIYATQLRQKDANGRLNYYQSGGVFHIHALATNNWGSPSFQIAHEDQVFEMSGGTIEFSAVNSHSFTALSIFSGDGNYNVSGGTVQFNTPTDSPSSNDTEIYSTAPLYNLNIVASSAGQEVEVVNQYGNASASSLSILNDLTIGTNATFNDNGSDISIGGDFNITGTFTQSGSLIFDGDQDGAISNNTGSVLTLPGLSINKERHPTDGQFYEVSLTGANNIEISGDLKLSRGEFDVVDFWPMLTDSLIIIDGNIISSGTGGLELTGSSTQYIKGQFGQEQEFGRIQLDNTGSTPQIELVSDINATSFAFNRNQVVNLANYNLTLAEPTTTATSWGTSCMFITDGTSGDGSLTMGFTVTTTNETVATFPVGQSGKYSPAVINASGASGTTAGFLTVVPVDSKHPTSDASSSTLDYYWKMKQSGFDAISGNLQYVFTYYTSLASNVEKKGAYLTGTTWNETASNVRSGSVFTFPYSASLEDDFTLGKANDYNTVRSLYAITDNTWDDPTSWSLTSGGAALDPGDDAPGPADFVIIEAGQTITIDASTAQASQVQIDGTLYVSDGTSGHTIDIIKGDGTLIYEEDSNWADYALITGSHNEFCNSTSSTIEFTGTGSPRDLPSNSVLPYYSNLKISGSGEVRSDQGEDLYINGNLEVESGTFNLLTYGNEIVTVVGDINIGTGTLTFNNAGVNRYLDVSGDINFTDAGEFNDTGSNENHLYIDGNIVVGSGIINLSDMTVVFEGTEDATFSVGSGSASFERVEVNKSVGKKIEFTSGFTLTGATTGATKPLELIAGECHLNSSDFTNLELNLSGAYDFEIPGDAILRVDNQSTVLCSSAGSGIKLEGSLILDNSGSVDIARYIHFLSTGSSSISVSNSAVLDVGSQISRVTNNDAGILSFTQRGGNVTIGSEDAGTNTRGMFEILGTGSSFDQAAGDVILIQRSNGSSTVPSLYFDPETVTYGGVDAGFTFDVQYDTNEIYAIYATESLNDITLLGGTASGTGSGNEIRLLTIGHTIGEDLTVGANIDFNANGLDLTLNGNLVVNGEYIPNSNTTYFTGASDQTISGSGTVSFADVIKETGAGTLILGHAITVGGDLTLSSGTLNTVTYDLTVEGDLTNDVTTVSTSGRGIVMGSTGDVQQVQGSGTFSIFTIDNTGGGVVLPTQSGSVNFTTKLRLEDGVFDIGRNLLVIDSTAVIETDDSFSESSMIQTNLSFTDNGIEKYFPVISGSSSFTYPIGSLGKYTPITLDVTSNKNGTGSPGSIRVKAADEPHVSVPVADQGSVLQYNWTLDADDITGFSADAYMYSYDDDAVGDTSAYYTARILLGSVNWNKYSTDEFMGYADATDISKFTFSNTDDAGIDGDYTAGGAIPDEVQAFISVTDGPWTTITTWATYDPDTEAIGTPGDGVPSGTGPKGAVVYIDNGDVVSMPSNFMSSYRTYIRETGILSVGSSIGHRLGDVMGTGTLKLENGDLPAGSYDNFFSASGGVLEYAGSSNYAVLSELPNVNSVLFSGTGDRELPNIDVQLYGDLTINGPDIINTYDSDIALQGDLIFSAGTFDAGIGTSTITFNGSTLQSVSGAVEFTSSGGGEFYNLEIDNASGLDLQSNAEVINDLYLTTGNIESSSTSMLTITNTATDAVVGGSSTSYVAGPMQKQILNSSSFTFPVGYGSTYGKFDITLDASSGGLWEAEYIGISPGAYATRAMDPETVTGDVAYVSHSEFWRILAPVAANAQLTLYWGSHSGVNPDTDFRLVDWQDLGTDAWSEVSIGSPTGDTNSGNVSTSGNVTFNEWSSEGNYYTFGSIVIPAYTWVGDVSNDWFTAGNWSSDIVPTAGSDVTIVMGTPNNAEIDGVAQMNDLTISSGTLTLAAGSQVTINGDLSTINDGLIIQNTVTNPTSVITYGTVSGEAQVQRTGFTERYWYHISHEVTGVAESEYDASIGADTYALNRFTTAWERVGGINEIYSDAYPFNDELEGYSFLLRDAGETLVYSGTLNSDASYSKSSLTGQWHHFANPYPSYIDVEEVGFDLDNFMKTVYIDAYNGLVVTYNIETNVGLNGGSRYIAPGQAMWLRNYVVSDFLVASSARAHSTGSLKSSGMDDENIFRMELRSSKATDEAVVLFGDNGSEEVTRLDSEKLLNSGDAANIYSLKASKKVAVNYLPTLEGIQEVVQLGYQVSESGMELFTYRANNIEGFYPHTSVYLVDKLEGVTVNLRETPSYSFTPQAAASNDRFELIFEQLTTDVENITKGEAVIYGVNHSAFVKLDESLLSESYKLVEVYNLAGQLIMQQKVDSSETELVLPKANTMYIIKASIGDNVYQKKVVTTN